ncbi:hypothetical protein WBP07_17245 [Novosphingobium sp. BL-8A]|uniref:hypothetical protein n=1 Tax=Novosphingobium sp. BL-8A TaxID=3127639 RepID=UPI0037579332
MTLKGAKVSHRSLTEWGVRAMLAITVGMCGYLAVADSVATALPKSGLPLAHRIAPWNARVAGALAREEMTEGAQLLSGKGSISAGHQRLASAAVLARNALRRDGTVVSAVTTLGMDAQINENVNVARGWFRYSESLSRRDLTTQLWMIEDAVQRGDISQALRHYDIALRTQPSAPDVMFPVLANAIGDPIVANGLVNILRQRRAWGPHFISFIASNSDEPVAVERFFVALRDIGVKVPNDASVALLDKLIANGAYDEAWRYYAMGRPEVKRQRSRDADFSALIPEPSELDWKTQSTAEGMVASIQPTGNGAEFSFSAPSNVGGEVLRQLQLLTPGDYVLEGRSTQIEQTRGTSPYWRIVCLNNDHEIGQIDVPNSSVDNGRFSGELTIPDNCPAQKISLNIRASDESGGVTGQIVRVQVRPRN